MRYFKAFFAMASAMLLVTFFYGPAYGADCPMHGGLASATAGEGKFGIRFTYDYTFMETLKDGTDEVPPDKVLGDAIASGAMKFTVPTEMVMQKYTLTANYAAAEKLRLVLAVPYVINDMKMRTLDNMGMVMDMTMDTIEGLGDVTVAGVYSVWQEGQNSLSVGAGVKTPTGKDDERKSNGKLVHAHMQPGSGSWDPLFLLTASHASGAFSAGLNAAYHMTTEGDEGYEFGDMFSADLIGRYQAAGALRVGLGLNFLRTAKDKDSEGKYSSPATSLIDNTENTGGASLYMTPEAEVRLGKNGSLSLGYQFPLYQDVSGIQQVTDWRATAALGFSF